jgi:outer membrane protein assembly factor BamB
VVGESLAYTLLSDGDSDFAVALDPTAAREIWRHRLDPTAEGADSGPGGSPVLSGDTLFALSTSCRLFALDAAGGRALWQIDLKDELAAGSRSRGCQSTPAVYQDTVIVSPAGETHRVVALDRATGRLVWSNGDVDPPRYASPVVAEILGEPQLLVHGYERSEEGSIHSTVYGLDPSSGTTLWRFSEASDWSFTTPSVMEDGSVLYSGWNRTIRISLTRSDDGVWEPRARWTSSSLESVVGRDGLIFAASGENLLCLRLDDGEQLWSRPIGRSFVTPYGGALAVLSSEAPYVRLVEASGEDYRELVRLEVFSPGAVNNTPPTVDGATLLVRNGEELVALRRRSAPAGPIR